MIIILTQAIILLILTYLTFGFGAEISFIKAVLNHKIVMPEEILRNSFWKAVTNLSLKILSIILSITTIILTINTL